MAQLQIRLFGGLRITADGAPLPPPTPQRAALLSYLLIFSDRMHARNLLAGLFWGDLPDTRARRNLNDAVYRLRQQLDPPGTPEARSILQSTATHVGFNPAADVWIDVQQFLQLVQHTATIEQQLTATQLYTGELLPGFYDDWLLLERERLAALHHQALANLLAHYQAGGMVDTALEVAQRLVAADPLREDTSRELMKLYYRVGRRDRALALYQSLRAQLAAELGVEPEQPTTELYHTIQRGWLGLDEPGGDGEDDAGNPLLDLGRRLREMPLVGRDPERRRLADWLSTPRSMRTPMLILEGETGVGKTRLAKDAADEAYRRGIFVLWGRYHEMAAPLPYGGLVEALRSGLRLGAPPPLAPVWLTEVSRLLPELVALRPDLPPPVSLPPEQERVRLWEGLVQYLLALASTGPQMIILEDVQWIDSASLDLWQYVLPRLPGSGFRLLGTMRSEELADREDLSNILEALESSDMLVRVPVRRLDSETVGEVVRHALNLEQRPGELGARLWQETEGNTFFALETLRLWAERGLLVRGPDGDWRIHAEAPASTPETLPTPASVRRVLTQRLQRLGQGARAVLEVGAVLGDAVPEALLWRASGGVPEAVLAPAEELLHRQLWIEYPSGYAFAHNKVREVVYEGISGPRKRYLHRRAAAALEAEQPDNVESLAHHYSLAEDWGRALPHLLRAAERARAALAGQQAIHYYERAIAALDRLPAESMRPDERRTHRFDILTERSWLYLIAGQLAAAQKDYDELVGLARHSANHEWLALAHTSRARFLMEQGRYTEALAEADLALLEVRQGTNGTQAQARRAAAAALSISSRIHTRLGNDSAALAAEQEALECFRQLGDRAGEADSLTQYAAILGRQGEVAQAVTMLREALAAARALGNRRLEGRVLNNLGIYSSDPDDTYDLLHGYLEIGEEIGDLSAQCTVHYNLAELTFRFGRYDEALEHAERTIALAENLGDQHDLADGIITRGRVWQAQGRVGEARAETLRGLGMLQKLGVTSSIWWGLLDLSRLMLDEGQWQGALANVEQSQRLWRQLDQPYGAGFASLFLALQARARLGLRHPGAARALVHQALAALDSEESAEQVGWIDPSVEVLARCYIVLAATGPDDEARAALERAHARLDAVSARCGPRLRRTYLEVVPECRIIRAAWAEYVVGRDKTANGATPPRENKVAARQRQILLLLQDAQGRGETLDDEALARELGVSLRTLQRDLADLRAAGRLA